MKLNDFNIGESRNSLDFMAHACSLQKKIWFTLGGISLPDSVSEAHDIYGSTMRRAYWINVYKQRYKKYHTGK